MEEPNQRRVSANGAAPVKTNAPASVFDLVRPAPKQRRHKINYDAIEVRKGVPIPMAGNGRGSPIKKKLLSMVPGDSIVVPRNSMPAVRAAAKALGIKVEARREGEGEDQVGIWRL